jgi:PII-like signaling protein
MVSFLALAFDFTVRLIVIALADNDHMDGVVFHRVRVDNAELADVTFAIVGADEFRTIIGHGVRHQSDYFADDLFVPLRVQVPQCFRRNPAVALIV